MKLSYKRLVIITTVAAISGVAVISSSLIAANSAAAEKYSPLTQKLSDTFNLDPAKVQKVIDEHKHSRPGHRGNMINNKLDKLVSEGTITQSQKDLIISKLKSLRQNFKQEPSKDHSADKQDLKAQLQQWLDSNGININLNEVLKPKKNI